MNINIELTVENIKRFIDKCEISCIREYINGNFKELKYQVGNNMYIVQTRKVGTDNLKTVIKTKNIEEAVNKYNKV